MIKRKDGFSGERALVLPQSIIHEMEEDPISSILHITDIGYYPKAWHHFRERQEPITQFVFIYCIEGSGWYRTEGEEFQVTANQYFILPAGKPHAYGANEEEPWTIYWIHFRGSKAPLFSSRFDKPTTVSPSAQSRIEERLDLFEEIFFTLNESTSMDHMHYANLCFAHFLGSFLFIDVYRNNFRPKEYSENVMNRVVHFMNDNIESNLKLADFANFCGYSESYFYRKFVKETGHSPMDYFTRLKINKACKLLIQTDMKVNQIAHKLGFKESQYFSRTFSNVMGLSPMEFRRQNFRL